MSRWSDWAEIEVAQAEADKPREAGNVVPFPTPQTAAEPLKSPDATSPAVPFGTPTDTERRERRVRLLGLLEKLGRN